jgi:hypothetical protein
MAERGKKKPTQQETPAGTQGETRDRPVKVGFSVEGGPSAEKTDEPSQ